MLPHYRRLRLAQLPLPRLSEKKRGDGSSRTTSRKSAVARIPANVVKTAKKGKGGERREQDGGRSPPNVRRTHASPSTQLPLPPPQLSTRHLPLHLSANNLLESAMPVAHLCLPPQIERFDAGGQRASKTRASPAAVLHRFTRPPPLSFPKR